MTYLPPPLSKGDILFLGTVSNTLDESGVMKGDGEEASYEANASCSSFLGFKKARILSER